MQARNRLITLLFDQIALVFVRAKMVTGQEHVLLMATLDFQCHREPFIYYACNSQLRSSTSYNINYYNIIIYRLGWFARLVISDWRHSHSCSCTHRHQKWCHTIFQERQDQKLTILWSPLWFPTIVASILYNMQRWMLHEIPSSNACSLLRHS